MIKAFIRNNTFIFDAYYYQKYNLNEQTANDIVEIIWTVLNCVYILGGMLGAFASKYILNMIGRKRGLMFNNGFSLLGSILAFICVYVHSAECIVVSRFLLGIQAGVAISAVPVYLSEISSHKIRGQTGTINEISVSFGIVVSQVLGLSQLLGKFKLK